MRSIDLKFFEKSLAWCSHDFVNLVDLIQFVFPVEERIAGDHFEENTTIAPNIHFVTVEAIGHEALGGSIPAGGDVLCEGLLVVDALA